MKGAITEPLAIINNPPRMIKIKIIGANHNFFLDLKNNKSSLINSIKISLIRIVF